MKNARPVSLGVLRQVLERSHQEQGCSRGALTVLAPQNDPYRVVRPGVHRDGRWLGELVARLVGERLIHLRGLHFVLVTTTALVKPNGKPLLSSAWTWTEQTRALQARKAYEEDADGGPP